MPGLELHLEGLTKRFGDTVAVAIPVLVIQPGTFFTFVGPSECGKSTLLNLIAGLEEPTTGTLRVGDRVLNGLAPSERGVGFVFQNCTLHLHRTVFENIAFSLQMGRHLNDEVTRRVRETADLLGLTSLLAQRLGQLSDSERQRVALGYAIVSKPHLFLFDEPLSKFDAPLRASMSRELKRLHAHLGTTFVYVTHDQEDALLLSDQIAVLRDGTIQQCGSPSQIYREPANTFVASFFGRPSINLVPAILEKDGAAVQIGIRSIQLAGIIEENYCRDVTVGIRPEHVRLSRDVASGWRGHVTFAESRDGVARVEVEVEGTRLVSLERDETGLQLGEPVAVHIAPPHFIVFDENGWRLVQV